MLTPTACSLSDYFSQHLGEYLNVLSSLESLNIAILKAMDKTKEVIAWNRRRDGHPGKIIWLCLVFICVDRCRRQALSCNNFKRFQPRNFGAVPPGQPICLENNL